VSTPSTGSTELKKTKDKSIGWELLFAHMMTFQKSLIIIQFNQIDYSNAFKTVQSTDKQDINH